MFYWGAAFFLIALLAGALGFAAPSAGVALIAEGLFFVFIMLGVFTMMGLRRVVPHEPQRRLSRDAIGVVAERETCG